MENGFCLNCFSRILIIIIINFIIKLIRVNNTSALITLSCTRSILENSSRAFCEASLAACSIFFFSSRASLNYNNKNIYNNNNSHNFDISTYKFIKIYYSRKLRIRKVKLVIKCTLIDRIIIIYNNMDKKSNKNNKL
jgi:hypothetical protein